MAPSAANALLTGYHVPGEALSALQSVTGRGILDPYATRVKQELASRLASEGRTLTERDLAATAVPVAVGRYVSLPDPGGPQPSLSAALMAVPGGPLIAAPVGLLVGGDGALASGMRHTGIFPIHGMELQKEVDRATIERATTSGSDD